MKPVAALPADTNQREPTLAVDSQRTYLLATIGVLLLALVWRLAIASAMPSLSRDGVGYCWNARALGEQGLAALKQPEFNQNPLYALAILAVQRALHRFGMADSPLLWQTAGQIVSLASGLGVVLLCGALTWRAARAAAPESDPRPPALVAMILAALLPLNVWLSVDVMSEQLFLCAYLSAACLLLEVTQPRTALLFGLLVGLAFLGRQEGAGLGLAGGVVLLATFRSADIRRVAICALLMAIGFLALAGPYWLASGRLTAKAGKETIEKFVPAPARISTPGPLFAALRYERRELYEAVPLTAYETIRGGRVVVPLLALGSLVAWRRRLLTLPLLAYTTAAAVHFSLLVLHLYRHGYLDPRHALVLVIWLIPPAATFLVDLSSRLQTQRRLIALVLLWVAALSPLAWYALRVPQAGDAYIRDAASWIRRQPAVDRSTILVGGSSQKRIAFYADTSFRAWEENAPSMEEKVASLVDHLGIWRPAARFFAIEVDPSVRPGHERHGNIELLRQVFEDSRVSSRDAARHRISIAASAELRLIELRD